MSAAMISAAAASFSACGGVAVVNYELSEDGTHYIVSGVSGDKNALRSYDIPATYSEEEGGELLPVTEIGDDAFRGCIYLSSVTLPYGIEKIGARAFMMSGLAHFTIPESVTSIGYGSFGSCSVLDEIIIPASVTTIEPYAFAYCSGLKNAEIYASIEDLPYRSFANSYTVHAGNLYTSTCLKTVTISATVRKIHVSALDGNLLEDIYFLGSEEQWNELYFYEVVEQPAENEGEEPVREEVKHDKSEVLNGVRVHFNGD